MIKLFTSVNYFKPEEIVIDNESFFYNIPSKSLSNVSLQMMRYIDHAELIDTRTGKIETPYGITGIESLSTGCKTVLNAVYITENPEEFPTVRAINATECGWNAIEKLLGYIEVCNSDMSVVIEHDNDLYKCSDREYIVNEKYKINKMFYYWACTNGGRQ